VDCVLCALPLLHTNEPKPSFSFLCFYKWLYQKRSEKNNHTITMTCKKNSWMGNLWRVTRKQMVKWSMLKIFKAKIFIDGFKYAKITILKRLISWLWEGCPDLNCRPAVCSLFNCISWTTPAFNISMIFVYCYVLLSRMFLFCIPA